MEEEKRPVEPPQPRAVRQELPPLRQERSPQKISAPMESSTAAPLNVADMKARLNEMSKEELVEFAKKWSTYDSAGFLTEVKDLTRHKKIFQRTHEVLKRQSDWKAKLAMKATIFGSGSYDSAIENINKAIEILKKDCVEL